MVIFFWLLLEHGGEGGDLGSVCAGRRLGICELGWELGGYLKGGEKKSGAGRFMCQASLDAISKQNFYRSWPSTTFNARRVGGWAPPPSFITPRQLGQTPGCGQRITHGK